MLRTTMFFLLLAYAATAASAKNISPDDMENDAKTIYDKTASGLNAGAIVVGALLALFGYRYKRATFFTIGFAGVGALVFLGVDTLSVGTDYQAWAPITSFAVAGLVAGALFAYFYKVGIFAVGAGLGVVGALLLQTAVFHRLSDDAQAQHAILYSAMVLFGLIVGCLTLKLRRPLLIVATSYIGTFLTTYGIGHFAGNLPSPFDLVGAVDSKAADGAGAVPTVWWVYLCAIAVFGTAAMMVQFKVTGKDQKPAANAPETNYLTLEAGKQYGSTASEKPFVGGKTMEGASLAYN